jgi:hypothetical protein
MRVDMTESENEKAKPGSRANKVRDKLRVLGFVRVEAWVPEQDVPKVKELEAQCQAPVLAAARESGLIDDIRSPLTDAEKTEIIRLMDAGKHTGAEVARMFDVHPGTITRVLQKRKKPNQK